MAVVIETTLGDITVDLFLEQRPVTCLNFLKLCKMKYYNFNLFHSIRSGFIAQTGDPTGGGNGGESIFGLLEGPEKRFFSGEKMPKIRHTDTGMLSMVGTGDMMIGSQFFFTLGSDLDSLDGNHCVIGEVTEGHEVLRKLNEVICDETHRPYQDVRITHAVVLEDPYNDPAGFRAPSRSPSPSAERLRGGRIAPDEELDDTQGKSAQEIQEMIEEKEAKARATILEMVGDLPDADIAPPENVLFVCKLNPVTTDEDLEIIFSRFGKIVSCEVIRDKKTGDSLQYAFIEFSDKKSCEDAYFKMDNVLIDDRRIHVDFSQSVSKIKWLGKGRGVRHLTDDEVNTEKSFASKNKPQRPKSNERDRVDRTDKQNDHDQNRQTTEYRRNREGNRERNRNRDEKARDKYRDQRENDMDKTDKREFEKERDIKREEKERNRDDNRDDRGRNGNDRETKKRIDRRENVQKTDDRERKTSDKERHIAEKRKGKVDDHKEGKGNKNLKERNQHDHETVKHDKRQNKKSNSETENNKDKYVRENKREERDRERKNREEKEPIRRERSRSRSKGKLRREANHHKHSGEDDVELSKNTYKRNHSIGKHDGRKINQSNSHESHSKDTPEETIRSESTRTSKKYEDKSKNRYGENSKKNDSKCETKSAVKKSRLNENIQDSKHKKKENSVEKSTEIKKTKYDKSNEPRDLSTDKPGRHNKTAKKEIEKKLKKKTKPKKKRKHSTSSSDSESSSSSSSSSESSSSSDSDKKKKRVKGRKRKASSSTSSSSSDSSTSSSSDSSSESSSSTSDSDTKTKKTKKKLDKKPKKK